MLKLYKTRMYFHLTINMHDKWWNQCTVIIVCLFIRSENSLRDWGGIFSLVRVRTCFEVCILSEKGYGTWEKMSLKKEEEECTLYSLVEYNIVPNEGMTSLKGQCHEIFDPRFFRQSITPRPLINTLKYFRILFRIRWAIRPLSLISRYAA
jgi:hypothetical protein